MARKSAESRKARALQERTQWSYSECLRVVRTMTPEVIESLIKIRQPGAGGRIEDLKGPIKEDRSSAYPTPTCPDCNSKLDIARSDSGVVIGVCLGKDCGSSFDLYGNRISIIAPRTRSPGMPSCRD